jgi:hypothetical protein
MKNVQCISFPYLTRRLVVLALRLVILALSTSFSANGEEVAVRLSGDMEVPAAKTMATGSGTIIVNADMSVAGGVTTLGVNATMAHIHHGAAGINGPVVIDLSKSGENEWKVPAGAKLSEELYRAYKAGELYVNVHSAQFKGGEIRGQIKR